MFNPESDPLGAGLQQIQGKILHWFGRMVWSRFIYRPACTAQCGTCPRK